MSLFNTTRATIELYEDGDQNWDTGEYVKVLESTITADGSWQPAEGDLINNLPEGKRNRSVYMFITETKIKQNCLITSVKNNDTLEEVIETGETYEMPEDAKNRNSLIQHYEYAFISSKESDE